MKEQERMQTANKIILGGAFALAAVVVVGIVVSITSQSTPARTAEADYADVRETARRAVVAMEENGPVRAWHCNPNEAKVDARQWRGLPSDWYRENAARALALMCETQGHGRSMLVIALNGIQLGRYHDNDRYEAFE